MPCGSGAKEGEKNLRYYAAEGKYRGYLPGWFVVRAKSEVEATKAILQRYTPRESFGQIQEATWDGIKPLIEHIKRGQKKYYHTIAPNVWYMEV